jgi:hypothetical protein
LAGSVDTKYRTFKDGIISIRFLSFGRRSSTGHSHPHLLDGSSKAGQPAYDFPDLSSRSSL